MLIIQSCKTCLAKGLAIMLLVSCFLYLSSCNLSPNENKGNIDSFSGGEDLKSLETSQALASNPNQSKEEERIEYQELEFDESTSDEGTFNFSTTETGVSTFALNDASDVNSTYTNKELDPQKAFTKSEEKIIREAEIGIELKNYDKNKSFIYTAVHQYGASIMNENEIREPYSLSNTIKIKVPNQNFQKLVTSLTEGEGIQSIDYKRINSADVSAEFVDLEARIKTKKAVENRIKSVLEKATSIKDILRVEYQLRQIREEIEAKEGRLKYLSNRVSQSTINLYVHQTIEGNIQETDEPGFFSNFWEAIKTGWKGLTLVLLMMVKIWPLLILIFAVGILIYKREKRKGSR